jgi:ketosteroid isomerase-like protein
MITEDYVQKIFKGLEQGDGAKFFAHVDDKVDWIVEGTHPLAGTISRNPISWPGPSRSSPRFCPAGLNSSSSICS